MLRLLPFFPALQLFHLAGDPGEKRDLAAEFPRLTARMNARLQGFLEAGRRRARTAAVPADETLKILRALGYIR